MGISRQIYAASPLSVFHEKFPSSSTANNLLMIWVFAKRRSSARQDKAIRSNLTSANKLLAYSPDEMRQHHHHHRDRRHLIYLYRNHRIMIGVNNMHNVSSPERSRFSTLQSRHAFISNGLNFVYDSVWWPMANNFVKRSRGKWGFDMLCSIYLSVSVNALDGCFDYVVAINSSCVKRFNHWIILLKINT